MSNKFEGVKKKRALTEDEIHRICRMTGSVTNGQASVIASAIAMVQSGKESISDWYERFCSENEEYED